MDNNQRILFESEVEFELFVSKVSEIARERINQDLSHGRSRVAVLMTGGLTLFVAALTGVATFGLNTLQASITDKIDAKIQSSVPSAIEASLAVQLPIIRDNVQRFADEQIKSGVSSAVSTQVDEAKLAWELLTARASLRERLRQIEETQQFANGDLLSITLELARIGEYKDIRDSEDFLKLLEAAVSTLFAADEYELVYRLESKFRDQMLGRLDVSFSAVTALGRRALGYEVLPGEMTGGKVQEDWTTLTARYHTYADAARRNGVPEVPFVYDFGIACMEGRSQAEISALLARIDDLTQLQVDLLTSTVNEILGEEWRLIPDNFSRRVMLRLQDCGTSSADLATSVRSVAFLRLFLNPQDRDL